MGLKFPRGVECASPGCTNNVTHQFSVRMRRQDSGADFAPNIPLYLCLQHATSGAKVTVLYEPTSSGHVEVDVMLVSGRNARTTPISRIAGVKV